MKYLGEEGVNTPLSGAVSVSNPYEFEKSAVIVPKKPFYDIKLTRDSIRTITRQKHILSQHFDIEFEKVISVRTSPLIWFEICIHTCLTRALK